MKQLDPKAVWLFFFSYIGVTILVVVFLSISALGFLMLTTGSGGGFSTTPLERIVLLTLVLLSPVFTLAFLGAVYIWAVLSYRFYKYELTERGFKKEYGVIFKTYVTIPYERIQNVDIRRGLLARILGLSEMFVQTAGASGETGSEGKLPGLSKQEAERIREDLVNRITRPGGEQGL